jgi:hypothetical protein
MKWVWTVTASEEKCLGYSTKTSTSITINRGDGSSASYEGSYKTACHTYATAGDKTVTIPNPSNIGGLSIDLSNKKLKSFIA